MGICASGAGLTDEQIELEHGLGAILARPETAALLGDAAQYQEALAALRDLA